MPWKKLTVVGKRRVRTRIGDIECGKCGRILTEEDVIWFRVARTARTVRKSKYRCNDCYQEMWI